MPVKQDDFEFLLRVNRILSSKLDLDDVLRAVMEMATKIVQAEASSLLLLDEKKNELYFDVAIGEAGDQVKQIRLKVGEGIAGWVAKEKKPLIVNDVDKDPRFTGKVDRSTKFKTQSILALPLLAMGKLIGVIEAINKEKNREFSKQDLMMFEAFAGQAAIAIENARLFSEVRREQEKLNTILSEMTDGVILLDEELKVLFFNQTAGRLLDLDSSAEGKHFDTNLLKGFEIAHPIKPVRQDNALIREVEIRRANGKDLILFGLLRRLEATKRLPMGGGLLILRDVTEERRGDLLKRNFLNLISHKLKTPLTVILGYAPALASNTEGMTDFHKKAIESIHSQGRHLSALVDKLLRFSLVESEHLEKRIGSVSLYDIMEEAVRELTSADAGIHIDPTLRSIPNATADPDLTRDVFKNLIDNGLKFNQSGKKEIRISGEQNGSMVAVRIQDNGAGIPSEEMEKVFQKFYQVENSFTGQVPGAGLGLPLCKKMMEAMGGRIRLDSTLGSGTTATVEFPRA